MIPNTNLSVNLTHKLRLERALKKAGVKDPATISKLTIAGYVTDCDLRFIRFEMDRTLQELDMGKAILEERGYMDFPFKDCTGLTTVVVPNRFESTFFYPFIRCTGIINMSALPGNPNYTSEDGVLFNKDKTRLVIYPDGKQGDYVIPNTVTAVAAGAFNDSTGLTSVTVPESVKNMDDAFCGCENLHTMLEVVNGYTNEIHAVSNGFLTNMASIVCDWEQIFRNETKSTVKLFSSIINDNTIINFSDKYISLFEVEEWVNWHKEFLEDEKRHNKDGHNFNVFFLMRDELGFHIQETKHDRLFMFLLDTHASHGQENMFLHEFLKILEIEEHDKGFWNIGKKGNMDILLQREQPHSIIIIENKSNWAGDQANQLYRYWYETIYQSTKKEYEKNKNFYSENKNKYQILYLAPNDKQYTTQTISISEQLKSEDLPDTIPMEIKYFPFNVDNQGVQKWLDNCIQSLNEKNHRIREYLTQYKMLCKTL